MKTDYYTNAKEHVISYGVFKAMSIHKVGSLIGGLAKEPRLKGKKARKKA